MLSREQLAEERGAAPGDVAAVERFAGRYGLEVIEVDPPGRRVRLRGSASAMNEAFGVSLERFDHPEGAYRGYGGALQLPAELHGAVVAVLGLDDRPQARPKLRRSTAPATSYTPPEVAAAYGLPEGSSADGVWVGLIELGGGFVEADLTAYFDALGLATPEVEAVSVDGATNAPTGSADGPDGEVMLDIEIVGSVASGASIAVYFGPNTDQGFADAISAAVNDTTRNPAIVSISWGGPEDQYSSSSISAFEDVFTDAGLVGATVFVAAGDSGSSDGETDGLAHVDYPASSPQVVGCGGTTLQVADGEVTSEVVWDDQPSDGATGGGVSAVFPLPAWQDGVGVPPSANPGGAAGRGVPDVAADADPDTGYEVRVDGEDTVFGGTSAVAPLFAALSAIAVAQSGPLGFVNPTLYANESDDFRDITEGNNGAYSAAVGWDACTGLGSPVADALVATLVAKAGSTG
jgi:kumamolisin